MARLVAANASSVTYDVVQFFEGEAARREIAAEGLVAFPAGDPARAGDLRSMGQDVAWYQRNVNPRLRTAPLAPGARFTELSGGDVTYDLTGGTPSAVDRDSILAYAIADPITLFAVTVEGGQIVSVDQKLRSSAN